MKLRRTHAGWAVKLWVIATVFLLPFMEPLQVLGWIAIGGVFGAIWRKLPEEPEPPVEKLPFHDRYAHKQVPRQDE